MSKIYPRHGSTIGGGGGERIRARPSAQQQQQQPRQQQQRQQQQQQQQRFSQKAKPSSSSNADDIYWPSLFTILCSIPVIFILYHYVVKILSKIIWGSLQISVEVTGPRVDHPKSVTEDSLYQWLMEWFAKNLKNLQNTSVQLNKKNGRLIRYPGFGITWFQYKGTWIKMERIQTPEIRNDDVPFEKVNLSFNSSRRTRTLLYELLEECKPSSKKKKIQEGNERVVMYEVDPKTPTCWRPVSTRGKKRRELGTVIVGDNGKGKLVEDVKEFLEQKEWYEERGIPYRRGYLLYGPPGCGKTCLAFGIAGEFNFDICSLSLTSSKINDDNLPTLINSAPDNCILLLEDVDTVMNHNPAQRSLFGNAGGENISSSTVTLSGLLNALDGILSPMEEGRIIVMTTSQVEKLDPALTRPGRVDMKLFLGYPNDDQLRQLYARFYPEAGIKTKSEFVKRVRELGITVTMAQMQGLFLFCKKDGVDAMNRMKEYFQEQFLISELEPNK